MKAGVVCVLIALVGGALASQQALTPPQTEGGKVRYDGWKILRVQLSADAEMRQSQKAMLSLLFDQEGAGVSPHSEGVVDAEGWTEVIVAPQSVALFTQTPIFAAVEVMYDDLQALFDSNARVEVEHPYVSYEESKNEFFEAYRDYDEVVDYFDGLVAEYPDLISKVPSIGQSYEGRDVWSLVLGNKNNTNPTTAIFWNGLLHCREWIAGHSLFYVTDALVRRYNSDPLITELMDNMEFHIVPVLNPDGYVETRTGNNMWRKNREPNAGTNCIGTDLNRNWEYEWATIGSSNNPCSDTYHGPAPGSAPEVVNIVQYLRDNEIIRGYIDWHSSGNLWMLPWGCYDYPTDHEDIQMDTGTRAADAIRSYRGTNFRVGPIYSIIYPVSGSSADTTYAFEADSSGRDPGFKMIQSHALEIGTSFQPSPNQIVPTGEEMLLGALVHAQDTYLEAKNRM